MVVKMLRSSFLLLAVGLAACAGAEPTVVIPTLAVLPTLTPSETPPPTETPTIAFTDTAVPTETATPTSTFIPSNTPEDTPIPTETGAPTETPSPTFTPSLTITNTITPTLTLTPTPSPDLPPLGGLAALAAQVTILPPEIRYGTATLTAIAVQRDLRLGATPTAVTIAAPVILPTLGAPLLGTPFMPVPLPPAPANCLYPPPGGLGALLGIDPTFSASIGCPIGMPPVPVVVAAAWQPFERGFMIYLQGAPGSIYVLTNDNRFRFFIDTWVSGVDPESGGELPPPGLVEPVRGFGNVWRSNPSVRAALGWAVAAEAGDLATLQLFERGRAIYLPARAETFILIDDFALASAGNWRAFSGGY
ncbi:MAG: hypothetical protein SNJ59_08225 [Aggregatilineales bacterium]